MAGAVARGAFFTLAGGAAIVALALAGVHAVWAVLLPQWLFTFGHGIHQPCGQAGAVGPFPHAAGAAAALAGFVLALTAFGVGRWLGGRRSTAACCPGAGRGLLGAGHQHGGLDAGAAPRRRAVIHGVCLAGPTAAGKTAVALAFAAAASAGGDRQRRLGAGLPRHGHRHRQAQRRRTRGRAAPPDRPARPGRGLLGGALRRRCERLIAEIRGRGRLPLLVGGTMLYFKALREGMRRDARRRPGLRAARRAPRPLGWPALHAELAASTPPPPRGWRPPTPAHPARAGGLASGRTAVGLARSVGGAGR
jgi:hypothetical protein